MKWDILFPPFFYEQVKVDDTESDVNNLNFENSATLFFSPHTTLLLSSNLLGRVNTQGS